MSGDFDGRIHAAAHALGNFNSEGSGVGANRIRQRVSLWRQGGYLGVTPTTARLLEYWTDPDRERKFFFCQIEALETAIYITEVAKKYGDAWIANTVREANDTANPGLPRTAFKMATGAGKTVVMAMAIAWHALNKLANTQDARFSDTFLMGSDFDFGPMSIWRPERAKGRMNA